MNSILMLEVARQRTADQHEAARKASQRRALRRALRSQRNHAPEAAAVELPPIPDYVDGTFRGAEDEAVAERTGTAG
ncbi:MAG: hypothetical protein J2P27_18865 [Actinobacteria bacterium]|nr:hypothetical protein [Actinomycetota bacterium]